MVAGTEVSLIEFGGSVIKRIVVGVENGRIYVCKPDEFATARDQRREPISIGFRLEDLAK